LLSVKNDHMSKVCQQNVNKSCFFASDLIKIYLSDNAYYPVWVPKNRPVTNREITMYEVTIRKTFSAAHSLKENDGKFEEIHGHNFIVEATLTGEALNREDLLIDFRVFKQWIKEALDRLDHKYLNHLDEFRDVNPSTERLAKWINDRIAPQAASLGLRLARITVWESEDARVSYEDRGTT